MVSIHIANTNVLDKLIISTVMAADLPFSPRFMAPRIPMSTA